MQKDRLSRNKTLKISKIIKTDASKVNTMDDLFSVKQARAQAYGVKFNSEKQIDKAKSLDVELDMVSKIAEESSDLIVITKTKKLGAYIIAISIKAPVRFRATFTAKMQNFCMEAIENMYQANIIRQDTIENKKRREQFQTDAIIKLKMLGYVALLAENAGCILLRQYKQISIQLGDAINLASAWKKSDNEKWSEKEKTICRFKERHVC